MSTSLSAMGKDVATFEKGLSRGLRKAFDGVMFDGNGLRPYAPAHLRVLAQSNGALAVSWVRRTRIDGDAWEPLEVPLGEETESYLLRIAKDGVVVREEIVSAPLFDCIAAAQAADAVEASFTVEVAQVSSTYGPGLFARTEITGL
ncbi:hypothetical protein [Sulfitobacter sp.]|uniref:hypothetical protein n=1 Tax=Sulfitobacter sp. TaxID=1903071 RepID=UPI0030034508